MSLTSQINRAYSRGLKYYVYTLHKPCGEVFYIGKGTGDRIHSTTYDSGSNSHKTSTIKKYGCIKSIYSFHETEVQALIQEEGLISAVGIENLTNINSGGKYSGNTPDAKIVRYNCQPITLYGKEYSSKTHARRELDLGQSQLEKLLKGGELGVVDRSGNRLTNSIEFICRSGRAVRVRVDGVEYSSVTKASTATGICKNALSKHMKGFGKLEIETVLIPVTIGKVTYPSTVEAAREYGVTGSQILNWKRAGRVLSRYKDIELYGKTYKTTKAAAEDLGISIVTVNRLIVKGVGRRIDDVVKVN
jgi:hypothetical protein